MAQSAALEAVLPVLVAKSTVVTADAVVRGSGEMVDDTVAVTLLAGAALFKLLGKW